MAIKNKLEILLEAREKEEDPEPQIAFRMMASTGADERGKMQVIVELCTNEDYFLEDGDIEIITEPQHAPEPYKVMTPEEKSSLLLPGRDF